MQVTVTGASGLIGRRLVAALRARGDDIVALSRDPERARRALARAVSTGGGARPHDASPQSAAGELRTLAWDPLAEPAPTAGIAGSEAIVNLAGENIAQRWSAAAKQAIADSRVQGTRNLVRAIASLPDGQRPATLLSGSAIGYYGAHGEEPLDEEFPPGRDFLAQTCAAWEEEADAAAELGVRVVRLRTGVVLDPAGGALAKMLPPFRLGVGGPVAGGRQFVSWIHPDDLVGILLAALEDERWRGAVNGTAPEPVRNAGLAKALGRALRRPALLPVPALALKALYGEMAQVVTSGARVVPAKALMNGYAFRYAQIDSALQAALGRR
jgi:uncharacterized protein (TIGR01777 family)